MKKKKVKTTLLEERFRVQLHNVVSNALIVLPAPEVEKVLSAVIEKLKRINKR